MSSPVRLYGYWRSSSTWRVRIGLALKKVAYETVPVHLKAGQQHSPEHQAKNPLAQVPVLEIDDLRLTQSVAILEYLEERFAEPALLPAETAARARVRELTEVVNSGTQPLQNFGVLKHLGTTAPDADPAAWGRHFIERGLAAFETCAARSGGRFSVGDQVTLADLALVPQLYNARRFETDLSQFPTLERIEDTCLSLDAFSESHPDRQPDADP